MKQWQHNLEWQMSGSDQPIKAQNIRVVQDPPQSPLAPGGAGPHDPGMEARMVAVELGLKNVEGKLVDLDGKVDRLDTRLRTVEMKVDRLDTRLTSLEGKVDGLDTRLRAVETSNAAIAGKLDLLVDKIPSWWQPPVSAAGMLALFMAAIAAAHYLKILS